MGIDHKMYSPPLDLPQAVYGLRSVEHCAGLLLITEKRFSLSPEFIEFRLGQLRD
jgi:hypothetical protein